MVLSTASAAAAQTGLPANVDPCWPGCSNAGGVADADDGADRQAAAEPLGQRDHVRHDAGPGVREPASGAADTGLHLVDHQQRAVLGGDLRAAARYPSGAGTTPASPMIGSRKTAATVSSTAARSAEISP